MHVVPFPIPYFRPQVFTEPPAMVRVVACEDVQWNRKLFKAPPLNFLPTAVSPDSFPTNLRKTSGSSPKSR